MSMLYFGSNTIMTLLVIKGQDPHLDRISRFGRSALRRLTGRGAKILGLIAAKLVKMMKAKA